MCSVSMGEIDGSVAAWSAVAISATRFADGRDSTESRGRETLSEIAASCDAGGDGAEWTCIEGISGIMGDWAPVIVG